jgi:hypothetical protein
VDARDKGQVSREHLPQDHETTSNDALYKTINRAVNDALERHEKTRDHDKSHVLEALFVLCCIWLIILTVDYFSYAPWFNQFRYSMWYHVPSSQVVQYEDKPPADCDFLTSPMGHKGCHYQKHVDLQPASSENGNKKTVVVYWSHEQGN